MVAAPPRRGDENDPLYTRMRALAAKFPEGESALEEAAAAFERAGQRFHVARNLPRGDPEFEGSQEELVQLYLEANKVFQQAKKAFKLKERGY